MSYSSVGDFYSRFDENVARDLCSDSGQPAPRTNDALLAVLDDAAGRILAACLKGRIYSKDDLTGLTGTSLSLLKRIQCEMAMAYLLERRPEKSGADWPKMLYERSEGYLEQLARGERLFDVENAQDAGLPTIDGPNLADYQYLNLLPDRTRHFFPSRGRRLPIGRGGNTDVSEGS
jgi:phage gp36-like protein